MAARQKSDVNPGTLIMAILLYAVAGLVWWCSVRNAENWLAIAVAEVIACLSGIGFAWWLIRFLRVTQTQKEEETPPSWRLFANRAVEIKAAVQSLEDRSRKQRAIRAAKVQAAQEAILARDRRTKAATDIARAAEPLARNVIQDLPWPLAGEQGRSREAAASAVQSAQQQFAGLGMPWGEAHEEHFREILGQVDELVGSAAASVNTRVAFVDLAKKGKQGAQPSDAETAAARLAGEIEIQLGGNGG